MRHIGKAYPGNVFAGLKRFPRRQRADLRQALGISLEGTASMDQLLSQIARRKITARDFVCKSDVLVAPREEPEIVSLAMVFLGKTLGEARSLFPENVVDIRGVPIPYDLLVVFIFLDNDHNMVVHGEARSPGKGKRNVRLEGQRRSYEGHNTDGGHQDYEKQRQGRNC